MVFFAKGAAEVEGCLTWWQQVRRKADGLVREDCRLQGATGKFPAED